MENKTLIYAPKVEAYVMGKNNKIIDLSKDIISGNVRRVTNGVSSASLTLNNKDARYTGVLKKMDRIYIRGFKGQTPYGLFMGYLTTVPVFDAYPVNTTIEAQCTLKQIMHTYWDPTSQEAIDKFIVEQFPIPVTKVAYNPLSPTPSEPGQVQVVGTEDQQRLLSFALEREGRYRYNNGPLKYDPDNSGYSDCSAFLRYCYKSVFGIDIGAYSVEQASKGAHIISGTTKAELDESKLQPGDIIAYDWAGWGRPTWDHVEMYIGNGKRIGHGSGQGPTIRPLLGADLPMAKFTVRRHITSGYSMDTPGGSANAGINVGLDEDLGGIFDDRTEYFQQQASDGLAGIRIKGFLNEVCGWDYNRILIEKLPDKLAELVAQFEIKEGIDDPEVMIQRVYRTIMGDAFANTPEQSQAVQSPNSFTGSEGGGDATYTKTMYGIGKVVSNLNYRAGKTDTKYVNGTGAYGLSDINFSGKPANTRTKEQQDAKMLAILKGYVAQGVKKDVKALADKHFNGQGGISFDQDSLIGSSGSTNRNDDVVNQVVSASQEAPVPNRLIVTNQPDNNTSVTVVDGQIDLYLKGLRETESGGNYTARNRFSSAAGAYQYITGTWNNYGGYATADLAPPEVQDRRARQDALDAYNRYKDWESVAASHMYPAWATKKHLWGSSPAPGNATMREYVDKVLRYISPSNYTGGETTNNPLTGTTTGNGDLMDMSFYSFFKQTIFNNGQVTDASRLLTGEKALMNDQSALDFVKVLAKGSMRHFQSDREGNFMAFYPDQFGMYKDNPKDSIVPIQDVEIKNFTIRATDTIYTHVYTLDYSLYPYLYGRTTGSVAETQLQIDTNGVVTFENEKMIEMLLGWKPSKIREFLQRHGGRPHTVKALEITNKTFSMIHTLATFMDRWAGQYNTSVDFTFMPELWPGNRASIGSTNVAVYVESVTHNFSYTSGFTTTATVSSPQSIGPNNFDLPKGAF